MKTKFTLALILATLLPCCLAFAPPVDRVTPALLSQTPAEAKLVAPGDAKAPLILWPAAPPLPAAPSASIKVALDQLFVIRSAAKIVVVTSPDGVVSVTAEAGPLRVRAKFTDGPAGKWETRTFAEKHVYLVEPLGVGRCELIVVATEAGEVIRKVLEVGNPPPGPDPPKPPQPPDPPDPKPSPAPIPEPGFRVLYIYESAKLGDLPLPLRSALTSQEIRQYLNAKCVVGPDGKTPERRFWDKDVDLSNASPLWKAAMARPRLSIPWLIISNGKDGYEGPPPPDVEANLRLLKKYGGE